MSDDPGQEDPHDSPARAGERPPGCAAAPQPVISRAVWLMALGAFLFSISSLCIKLVGQGVPAMQIVFVRSVLGSFLCLHGLSRAGHWPHKKSMRLLAMRGVSGALAVTATFQAIVWLPLGDATTIFFTNPVFATILAVFFLGERAGPKVALCVGLGLAGVVFIAKPTWLFGGEAALPALPVWMALAGAFFAAVSFVTIRRLGNREHPLAVVLAFVGTTSVATAPVAVWGWVWPTPGQWLLMAAIAVLTHIGQVFLTRGLETETAGKASAVGYLQIVFAALWGFLFFGETMDSWDATGAMMIIGSTLALHGRVRKIKLWRFRRYWSR